MLNRSGVTKQSFGAPKQILLNPELQFSLGVVVSKAKAVTVDGKKIVKAGTPLVGSLDARTTAFTVAGTEDAAKTVGVLLHDVDVTNGNANGTLLIFGFVNTNMLDADVKTLLTASVKAAINVKFIAG